MNWCLVVRSCVGAGALFLAASVGGPGRANLAIGSEISAVSDESPPAWLYPINPPRETDPAPDLKALRGVPGSAQRYTNEQVDDLFIAPDWHPGDHAPAPMVVSRGRPPETYACGYCHRITGSGAPENAHLAGLSVAYIRQQLQDFSSGARRSSRQERIPQAYMTVVAQSLTSAEIDDAAGYFRRTVTECYCACRRVARRPKCSHRELGSRRRPATQARASRASPAGTAGRSGGFYEP